MSIRIFVTGGTFDKEYNELNGELFARDASVGAIKAGTGDNDTDDDG